MRAGRVLTRFLPCVAWRGVTMRHHAGFAGRAGSISGAAPGLAGAGGGAGAGAARAGGAPPGPAAAAAAAGNLPGALGLGEPLDSVGIGGIGGGAGGGAAGLVVGPPAALQVRHGGF